MLNIDTYNVGPPLRCTIHIIRGPSICKTILYTCTYIYIPGGASILPRRQFVSRPCRIKEENHWQETARYIVIGKNTFIIGISSFTLAITDSCLGLPKLPLVSVLVLTNKVWCSPVCLQLLQYLFICSNKINNARKFHHVNVANHIVQCYKLRFFHWNAIEDSLIRTVEVCRAKCKWHATYYYGLQSCTGKKMSTALTTISDLAVF